MCVLCNAYACFGDSVCCVKHRERERERETETDRQTDRQTDIERQKDRETETERFTLGRLETVGIVRSKRAVLYRVWIVPVGESVHCFSLGLQRSR